MYIYTKIHSRQQNALKQATSRRSQPWAKKAVETEANQRNLEIPALIVMAVLLPELR